ncbi:MAG TPA: protein-disulfide reductase DsbD family protein [Candidatus Avalokitesvara rifleensis]|uniref:protein-disulfide reductase DsbD family protein n=1 Tax=Candidatus Avalokitesvara rifleensis TaxID=3367620 RepID=UPI00402A1439
MRLIIASVFILSILSFGVLCSPPGFDVYVSNGSVAMAADEGGAAPQVETKQRFTSIMEEHGLALAIVFAFWWGLLANVGSPCVFPLVPITVAYFATQGETRGKRYTILLAGVYVLGIATLFAPLGVASAMAGKNIGSLMGNPFFIGPFVAFLVAMSLSMFGLYEIKLPGFIMNRMSAGERKTGIAGTFFMGIILGFVAAPCVGPFLASILGFVATTGSVLIGLITLFCFALGLGMPYLFLAIFAKTIAGLPRAGEWMVRVKQFAGMIVLLVAVWFMSKVVPVNIAKILGGMTLVGMGVFLDILTWKRVTAWNITGRVFGIFLALGGLMLFTWGVLGVSGVLRKAPEAGPGEGIRWVTSFDEGMKLAKEEGKPVFIDFYAEWCTDCKVMDTTTWINKEVVEEAKRFVSIKLDCSKDDSPYNKLRIERFKSFAMPFMAFFDSKGNYLEDYSIEGYTGPKEFLERARAIK